MKLLLKGYAFAILSAVIYGCMPLMSKLIYAEGVSPLMLVFLRNACSILPLCVLACLEKKTLAIPVRVLPRVGVLAFFGCALTPILLFSSYQFMESGTATVFHFVYPAIVIVIELLVLKTKVPLYKIIAVVLCVVGVGLFYSPGKALGITGSALALCSGITFAIYVVLLSHFRDDRVNGFLLAFYSTVISSFVLLAACLITNDLSFPTTLSGWGLCVLFSLAVTTGAVVLFQKSTSLIGGERTAILSTLEPITSLVIGVTVFQEDFGLQSLCATVLVIGAGIMTALFDLRGAKRSPAS